MVEKVDGAAELMSEHEFDVELTLEGIGMIAEPEDATAVLAMSGSWSDSDLAVKLGVDVTVAVAGTVFVKRLIDNEVLPAAVMVTSVPRSEFVLLKVASDMKVDEVEKLVGTETERLV